jgi:Na+/H+ antiporter NhaC
MKKNLLRTLGFILIWIVPLVYVLFIAVEYTSETRLEEPNGSNIAISVWGMLILAVLILVYITQVRKRLTQVLHISELQERPVPAFWRVIQLLEYAISFGLLIGGVFVINQLSSVLYTFAIVSLISGTLGYVLLMFDSIKREKLYQEKKMLRGK